ncbi:hypothetical protein ACHAWF_006301 [Thalassiosira exigua]
MTMKNQTQTTDVDVQRTRLHSGGSLRSRRRKSNASRNSSLRNVRPRSTPALALVRLSSSSSSSSSSENSFRRIGHKRRSITIPCSTRNEDWGDVVAPGPSSPTPWGPDAKENAVRRFVEECARRSPPPEDRAAAEAKVEAPKKRRVRFSDERTVLENPHGSRDATNNAWYRTDVPRTLRNLELIYRHRGIAVSYPASAVSGASRPGRTCMVRMETPAVIDEIERVKDEHRRAVLGEQARQRASSGARTAADVEALRRASCDRTSRCVEMCSCSWWLKRMDYRCV